MLKPEKGESCEAIDREILAALLISGCAAGTPSVDLEAEAAELMRISREWSDVAATGDIDAILAGWAENAVMMAPGQPPIRGKQAIRAYIESTGSIPGFSIRWEPGATVRNGWPGLTHQFMKRRLVER